MRRYYLIGCLFLMLSCNKADDFGPQGELIETGLVQKVYKGALVLNEGNFGFGNSSLSVLDLESNEVQNNVFERVNKIKLGDVAQSSFVSDSIAFLVINNSNKVVVVSLNNFSIIKEINVPGAPRYITQYEERLFVSTMGSGSIYEISLSSLEVKPFIKFNAWLDEIVVKGNELYACNRTQNSIEVFDLKTNTHLQSYKVGKDPESIGCSSNGDILILCSGGYNTNDRENASVYSFQNSMVQRVYTFVDIEDSPSRLRYNGFNNKWYFINHGLFYIQENFRVKEILNQSKGEIFYGLGINSSDGTIYLTNVNDYVEKGELICLSSSGNVQFRKMLGIIPQHVTFY